MSGGSEPINSGAINTVSFPGAEDGLSLVQLIGEVNVATQISSVYLRLNARAAIGPVADSSSGVLLKIAIGATASCDATGSAAALSKIKVFPTGQSAYADALSGIGVQMRIGVSGSGVASIPSTIAKSIAYRSASAQGAASGLISSINRATRGASGAASAQYSQPRVFTKLPLSAATGSYASASASAKAKYRLSAHESASVSWSINGNVENYVSGSTVAEAIVSVVAYSYDRVGLSPIQPRAITSSGVRLMHLLSAQGDGMSVVPPANPRLILKVGASTSAIVSYAAAAADYSVTIPAPIERQMIVPEMNRRMEVTE
jgi:hypothetical protein